jgi:hypothetical protein
MASDSRKKVLKKSVTTPLERESKVIKAKPTRLPSQEQVSVEF